MNLKKFMSINISVIMLSTFLMGCQKDLPEEVNNDTEISDNSVASGPPQNLPLKQVEGFRVITIGTSGPPLAESATWPSTLVQFKDKLFLVDCGAAATHGLVKASVDPSLVKNMLFTHHHADHDSDYFSFAIGGWNGPMGRRELRLVGPEGTDELHKLMMDYYQEDLQYRMKYSFPPEGLAKNVFYKEVQGEESFVLDGVQITTAKMSHTIDTVAYRFDSEGQSVVVSGDTGYSENLIKLAQGADILVMDAHIPLGNPIKNSVKPPVVPQADIPEGFEVLETELIENIETGANTNIAHASLEEICKMAIEAGVKKLVLTHLPPQRQAFNAEEVSKFFKDNGFEGEVVIASDLAEFNTK